MRPTSDVPSLVASRPRRARWAAAALLLAALRAPSAAFAQDKSAEGLRKEAKETLDKGDTAAACVLFEQAYQAATKAAADAAGPKPNDVLFELAACHEKAGQKDLAATEYEQVAAAGGA